MEKSCNSCNNHCIGNVNDETKKRTVGCGCGGHCGEACTRGKGKSSGKEAGQYEVQ